ncbi:hypothetical protein GCM10009122_26320 [Fulvivirga kasyanovii]|uniref:Signal peptidase I n=1 Tax=Fulvivirga kasyanovii TaxID=396812 RepID=A0ABW9RHM9_9BACT|nr:signal peptidase I [Fulvivirga kasyanovii]MTI23431.1 signal peptidase I [Fulvivirga kasyanovii]
MNKGLRNVFIGLAIILGVVSLLHTTRMIGAYNFPTYANEPGIMAGSKIIVSSLITPERGDFICFDHEYNNGFEIHGSGLSVFRLIALPHDIVEIRSGVVFVNNQNIDENMELNHVYVIKHDKYKQLLKKGELDKDGLMAYLNEDSSLVCMSTEIAKRNGLSDRMYIDPENKAEKEIKEVYQQNWNRNNFGPLEIPEGKYFVLGDNRDNALDSRYIGLIDEARIIGTVINVMYF